MISAAKVRVVWCQNGLVDEFRMTEWHSISEPLQLQLAQEALRQATNNLAAYAEALAAEMEGGHMSDRGGNEALRLFATLVRSVHASGQVTAGHA